MIDRRADRREVRHEVAIAERAAGSAIEAEVLALHAVGLRQATCRRRSRRRAPARRRAVAPSRPAEASPPPRTAPRPTSEIANARSASPPVRRERGREDADDEKRRQQEIDARQRNLRRRVLRQRRSPRWRRRAARAPWGRNSGRGRTPCTARPPGRRPRRRSRRTEREADRGEWGGCGH